MGALKGGGLNSFRYQFGGDTAMAIAELIDNSIQWKKGEKVSVEVRLIESEIDGDERLTEIQILDNGIGMNDTSLGVCLDFGGGANIGTIQAGRLGKFGLGLPYSSCSQSLNYSVYSWQQKNDILRVNRNHSDFGPNDDVPSCSVERLDFDSELKEINGLSEQFDPNSGTLVVWRSLDKKKVPAFSETLINHCSFLFGRIYRGFILRNELDLRLVKYRKTKYGLDLERSILVEVNDPLFLSGNHSCPKPYNEESTNEIVAFRPEKGMDKGDDEQTPGQRVFKANEKLPDGSNVLHEVVVRHSRVKKKVYSELKGLKSTQSPIIKYYRDSNGISLMRSGRELKLSKFGFNFSGFSELHRWYSIEVSFEPISDEIFDVDANKTDARKFRCVKQADVGNLDPQHVLMNDISDYITGLINFHTKAIKEYGKEVKKNKCPQCEQQTIEQGRCSNEECGHVLTHCNLHPKVRLVDGQCAKCGMPSPKACFIHKVPLDSSGNCSKCPPRNVLSEVQKRQVLDFLENKSEFKGNKKLQDEALLELERSNGKHFFIFTKNKARTTFVDFEEVGEEFTLIEINKNHAFYEMVLEPMIDNDNEEGLEALKFLIGTMAINESQLYQHRLVLETARANMGVQLQQLLASYSSAVLSSK
jgi:hypothetical protein